MACQLDWRFKQCFEGRINAEDPSEDALTAISFDHSGDWLACGDRGGFITLYERTNCGPGSRTTNAASRSRGCDFRRYYRFQSHEQDFDYLKSLDIEPKINQIKFLNSNQSKFFLTTNDKTIKLWKIHNKRSVAVVNNNLRGARTPRQMKAGDLVVPGLDISTPNPSSAIRRLYANAHAYIINSLSVNSDGETFLSADDLRINLWNLEHEDMTFNVVDIKPPNMEDLTEVITAAEFHPSACNMLMYTSSKGAIKLCDLREQALCGHAAKTFEEEENPATRNFFSEIIASVSDAKFTKDGRYIVSRDYLTLKIWDVNMESRPVKTINIHEQLRSRLVELYETESIFDKFEVALSNDGNNIVTGSYNNSFHIYDRYGRTDACIEISRPRQANRAAGGNRRGGAANEPPDYQKKVLNTAWSPTANTVAVAAGNQLFTFCA